jgi:hypothetical protein
MNNFGPTIRTKDDDEEEYEEDDDNENDDENETLNRYPGRGASLHRYPGPSCLATINLSLRDKSHSPQNYLSAFGGLP